MRLGLATVVVAAALLAAPGPAQALGVCPGETSAAAVPQKPGELLRFGITPAGEAGALGPAVPAVPGSTAQDLDALARLRPGAGAPFVIRLNRFFWSLGEPGIQHFEQLARTYTDNGYQVELQLRYHPTAAQEGKIGEWTQFVREVVDRLGSNRGVVALQVTNEVNFTLSPDSSDGGYAGARDALIAGVEAAHDEARARDYGQLAIGFNWFYRSDPLSEDGFWSYLRDHGGPSFAAAVDWVGLDAYPGTIFPPAEPPGGYRDGMVNAMSVLRDCFMPVAGLGPELPIHVEENGYPTGPLRSDGAQLAALGEMARAVDDFRGTYNVSDYRWFDLRDHDSSSLNFQHHYGLLYDDYTPKPAFDAYAQLVRSRSRPGPPAPAGTRAFNLRRALKRCKQRKRPRARKRCVKHAKRKAHALRAIA
ncbi:MAG: hypothetical protein ABR536_00220 [Solirubrobacterales bacterium]